MTAVEKYQAKLLEHVSERRWHSPEPDSCLTCLRLSRDFSSETYRELLATLKASTQYELGFNEGVETCARLFEAADYSVPVFDLGLLLETVRALKKPEAGK